MIWDLNKTIEIIGVEFDLPTIHIMFKLGDTTYSFPLKHRTVHQGLEIIFDSIVFFKESIIVNALIDHDHYQLFVGRSVEIKKEKVI